MTHLAQRRTLLLSPEPQALRSAPRPVSLPEVTPSPAVEKGPQLRLIRGGPFQVAERERVALRTWVHTGARELRGVATRIDENAVEVFGVNRGLKIGETVVAKIELHRGEPCVWMPTCVHAATPSRTLLWFDRPQEEDCERLTAFMADLKLGRVAREGLFSYFHAPKSSGLQKVCVLPPG